VTQQERTPDRAIDFKSATLDTVRLVLQPQDLDTLLTQLQQHLEQSAGFFAGEAVVIDASALQEGLDWATLQDCLRAHELHPLGVVATGAAARSAEEAGLPLLSLSRPQARPSSESTHTAPPSTAADASAPQDTAALETKAAAEATDTAAPAATPQETAQENPTPEIDSPDSNTTQNGARPTKVIQRQLRSGQRIYAQDSDLIIIGVVSQGAEVIADGNIHVYGPLRGRAMAGASGNTEARIFTTELDPELIAIAGVYKVIEEALPDQHRNQNAVISLHGESLKIESIR